MSRKRIVIANWKQYIESPDLAKKFAAGLRRRSRQFSGVEAVVAPPFPFIPVVAAALKGSHLKVGAQSVSTFEGGAYTGFVSALMIKNSGALYVIVGHSERRSFETNQEVAAQLEAVSRAGLTAVLCVGEQARDPAGAHFTFIEEELTSALKPLTNHKSPKIIVAYEPVWAIGKSAEDAMRPQELREMSIFIQKILSDIFDREAAKRIPILYGGSVEASNARALMNDGGVSGFLVGHASVNVEAFVEILKSCKSHQ